MSSTNSIEIKIERNLAPDVKKNIFVTKPGTGRNHCLMGIHLVGKSTLVSDWAIQWENDRKACIQETLNSAAGKTTYNFFQKEKIYELRELPELAKIFYFEDQVFHLGFDKLNKILTDIKNGVLVCQSDKSPYYYEKKRKDYIIRTKDGFAIKITESEHKKAVEEIESVYSYFSSKEPVFSKENWMKTTEKIEKLFRAFTILGFHIILIFDEFNKGETGKQISRRGENKSKSDQESKEAYLNLLRKLYPYEIEAGAVTNRRWYNLSMLIVSRQEMGMITGEKDDDFLFSPWCLDGFSNSQLEEYIERLKRKEKNGISPYAVINEVLGEKKAKKTMIHCCGRHPGLWGQMWDVLNMTYDAYLQDKDVETMFYTLFRRKSNDFFEHVIALMRNTNERIDDREERSALKIFIHHFVDKAMYPIPNDKENKDLLKYLEMMEKQGFISARNALNSFQVLEDKVERGMCLEAKYTFEVRNEIKNLLGYEMHSPYFTEYINSNWRKIIGYDKVDLENISEKCELEVRKLLDCVYKTRYGQENWLIKIKNRLSDLKKKFWYLEVCKQCADESVSFAQKEAETIKAKHTPWDSLAYSDYGDLLKMHSYVFEKVLGMWVEEERFSDATFKKDMIRMADIRNTFAHKKAYNTENLEDDMEVYLKFLRGIYQGTEMAINRAKESSSIVEENVIDLYDVEFVCVKKDAHKTVGKIYYNQEEKVAKILKANVTRKVEGEGNKEVPDDSDTYYDDLFTESDTIRVDVVKCCKENNGSIYFVVQPIDRSGVQAEWIR